jgi:fucose 4-O-acetylase-like acetyltransferase
MKNNHHDPIWDIFKGSAIVLVVLGHVLLGLRQEGSLLSWLYSFHMSLFFFAAGSLAKTASSAQLIKNKFKRLLIPYLTVGILHWGLNLLFNHYTNASMSPSQLLNLLHLPYGHLWYLYCLFGVFIIANFMHEHIQSKTLKLTMALSMGIASYWIIIPQFTVTPILFFIGYFVYGFQFQKINRPRIISWGACILFLATTFLYCTSTFTGLAAHFLKFLNGFIAIEFFLFFSKSIANHNGFTSLKEIGKHSYEIYLTHVWFTAGIRILLQALGVSQNLIHIGLGISLGVWLPYILFKWLVHPYPMLRFAFLGLSPKIK